MPHATHHLWTRRDVLRCLGAGVAAATAGCTPARILTGAYPAEFKRDEALNERMIRAFILAVVPGVDPETPNLTSAFGDPFYGFAPHRAFFASDLCRRSGSCYGGMAFDRLTVSQRTRIVQDGLAGDGITRRLYGGAVFLAQVSVLGGIYDDERGSPLIRFDGRYRPRGPAAFTYPCPEEFLATPMTSCGNPS